MPTLGRPLSIHARVAGGGNQGPAIVLVHGIAVSSRYMVPTLRELSRRFAVYAPDLPGFGLSTDPDASLDVEALARVLSRWIETRGLAPCILLGNSFGCQVVVDVAARRRELVSGLVLAGPTVDPAARTAPRQAARWVVNAVREPVTLPFVVARDVLDCGLRRVVETFGHGLRDPIEEKLPSVRCPTLVVRGERDVLCPQRWAMEAVARLPSARLEVIPGVPHAVNWNAPRRLAALVDRFVRLDVAGRSG